MTSAHTILKAQTCPSLSGRSELTYHIGKSSDGAIFIRITQNSGTGLFNADWVSLDDIETLITGVPESKLLTSSALQPVYRGKSSNSPAFLFAALKAEALVATHETKDKGYLAGDFQAFRQYLAECKGEADAGNTDAPPVTDVTPQRRKGRKHA